MGNGSEVAYALIMGTANKSKLERTKAKPLVIWALVVAILLLGVASLFSWVSYQFSNNSYKVTNVLQLTNNAVSFQTQGTPPPRVDLCDGAIIFAWGSNGRSAKPLFGNLCGYDPLLNSKYSGVDEGFVLVGFGFNGVHLVPKVSFDILVLPLWIPPAIIVLVVLIRRWMRKPPYACRSCGYDLRGTAAPVCPECAHPVFAVPKK
ncbi:hypothetical protein LBMAG48_02430 [Phycisphaerae bacterium]|jgi:hypothetical protein|nr:hypothetical protein LBMAG48_02430 [Phycisphaerae bacterium]